MCCVCCVAGADAGLLADGARAEGDYEETREAVPVTVAVTEPETKAVEGEPGKQVVLGVRHTALALKPTYGTVA